MISPTRNVRLSGNFVRDRVEVDPRGGALGPAQDLAAHRGELLIHVRVVNDFADEERALVRKFRTGLIRVLDRAVDAVAEAEFPGEPKREIADREGVSGPADRVHDLAVIVGRERAFNGTLEPEAFAEIGLFHRAQSNRPPRPPRTASSTRCTCQPSVKVAGSPCGAAPLITATISRISRTNRSEEHTSELQSR